MQIKCRYCNHCWPRFGPRYQTWMLIQLVLFLCATTTAMLVNFVKPITGYTYDLRHFLCMAKLILYKCSVEIFEKLTISNEATLTKKG